MTAPVIQVTGLKELRKSLKGKETDTGWRPILKSSYSSVAMFTQEEVRAKASGRSNPRMGHVAVGSIVGKATATNASIVAYKGIAHGPGHEFGSNRFRQFPPVQKGGWNIYPTIQDQSDKITDFFFQEMNANFNSEGL